MSKSNRTDTMPTEDDKTLPRGYDGTPEAPSVPQERTKAPDALKATRRVCTILEPFSAEQRLAILQFAIAMSRG